MSIFKFSFFILLLAAIAARGDLNSDAMKLYGMCFTPLSENTVFITDYKVGEKGEFFGNAHVSRGEMEFTSKEFQVPSITADEGVSLIRTLGIESAMLEIHPVAVGDTSLFLLVANKHRINIKAGSVVEIGVALHYMRNFVAVWVQSGSITVGGRTLTPEDKAMFISGTKVYPNGGGVAFMSAVRQESSAYAQSLRPGLTVTKILELRDLQRSGARAIVDSAVGAGMIPMYEIPFVPERPLSLDLSPSGTP